MEGTYNMVGENFRKCGLGVIRLGFVMYALGSIVVI